MCSMQGDGHRQHEERRGPVDLQGLEVGQRQPGRSPCRRSSCLAHQHGTDIARDHAAQDGNELDPALQNTAAIRVTASEMPARVRAVAGGTTCSPPASHGHVAGHLGHRQADHHDHRANHHEGSSQHEAHARARMTAARMKYMKPAANRPNMVEGGNGLGGIDDGAMKAKLEPREDRHLATGAELEQQGALAPAPNRTMEGFSPVSRGTSNHGTEGDKQNLQPGDALLDQGKTWVSLIFDN